MVSSEPCPLDFLLDRSSQHGFSLLILGGQILSSLGNNQVPGIQGNVGNQQHLQLYLE